MGFSVLNRSRGAFLILRIIYYILFIYHPLVKHLGIENKCEIRSFEHFAKTKFDIYVRLQSFSVKIEAYNFFFFFFKP